MAKAKTKTIDAPVIERNELSKNSRGGTELMADALLKHADPDLLSKCQIICSRVRDLQEGKKRILWLHDLPNDPESARLKDAEFRDKFDGIVYVSNWQMNMYNGVLGIPYGGKAIVIQNAIEPIKRTDALKSFDGKVKLIYHTTPHRGLTILYPVFDHLTKFFGDKIELDVYSSFSIYGWPQRDAEYAEVIQKCKDHPQINYHGAVSNEEVREALSKAHIFAYPSIWPETSCIAGIEALASGCIMVAPNFAALPETMANFGWVYQWSEDVNEHANRFAKGLGNAVETVLNNYDALQPNLMFQSDYFNHFYGWPLRKNQWDSFLHGVVNG